MEICLNATGSGIGHYHLGKYVYVFVLGMSVYEK